MHSDNPNQEELARKILLYSRRRISHLSPALLEASARGEETPVKMGQPIGQAI